MTWYWWTLVILFLWLLIGFSILELTAFNPLLGYDFLRKSGYPKFRKWFPIKMIVSGPFAVIVLKRNAGVSKKL